jgi:FkbM family methyltransferase
VPGGSNEGGWRPGPTRRFARLFFRVLNHTLRINGRGPISNEFLQSLNPHLEASIPTLGQIKLVTGNGRLLWRARKPLEGDPLLVSFLRGLNEKSTFYDIGANVGVVSIFAAEYMRRRLKSDTLNNLSESEFCFKTIAIEPGHENFSVLCKNIRLNNLENQVMPLNFAVSSSSRVAILYLRDHMAGAALHSVDLPNLVSRARYGDYEPGLQSVVAARVDFLISIFGLPSPNVIKVDIDGRDIEALESFGLYLSEVSDIFVENDTSRNESATLLQSFCKRFNFFIHDKSSSDIWLKRYTE